VNSFKLAVQNIGSHGDTDIFPFPVENALFYDNPKAIETILEQISKNFATFCSKYPVDYNSSCIPVGQFGFRLASQIDPIWNAYYLSRVLHIGENIEKARLPVEKEAIFSYRFNPDLETGKLFSQTVSWRKFIEKTIELAGLETFSHVVKLDISDFYSRIYHHRLENAITRISTDHAVNKEIKSILQDLSANASYGLPVGGNASRILAELLLNSIDQMLFGKRIRFCRYVDDFVLFAKTKEDGFRILNLCADYLMKNEGLAIQKTKTQIISTAEYITQTKHFLEGDETQPSKEKADFMNLHIYYDPYSETAQEDYDALKEKLAKFDVNKLIKEEIRKSRIHQALGKQLLNAVAYLEGEELGLALNTIASNFGIFYPIFPSVIQVASKKISDAPSPYKEDFIKSICGLIEQGSYITQGENNSAYVARLLSKSNLEEADQVLISMHASSTSPLVRSNCIYAMTNKRVHYWLSSLRPSFITMSRAERRAFIIASYILGDEGSHWRKHSTANFSEFEIVVRDWAASKFQSNPNWMMPL